MPLYKMDTIFKKGQKKKKIKKFLFLNKRRRWLKFPFIFKIYTPPPPNIQICAFKAIIRTCNDYKTTKLNFT